ncbi:hypothetical protein SBA3_4590002 [Candidatus Sulfopaludibacter sp. SbA3]|nr:hypothetical protein SBA3_4590002 [Candidatus Sulfopaludibacter sp. SbA3]
MGRSPAICATWRWRRSWSHNCHLASRFHRWCRGPIHHRGTHVFTEETTCETLTLPRLGSNTYCDHFMNTSVWLG